MELADKIHHSDFMRDSLQVIKKMDGGGKLIQMDHIKLAFINLVINKMFKSMIMMEILYPIINNTDLNRNEHIYISYLIN